MSHSTANVTRMKSPSTGFGSSIRRIENAGNVLHSNLAMGAPILNSKPLVIDVTGAGSRTVLVDHSNSSFVIAEDFGRFVRWKAELSKDGTKIFGSFSRSNSRIEFTFSTTKRAACL